VTGVRGRNMISGRWLPALGVVIGAFLMAAAIALA